MANPQKPHHLTLLLLLFFMLVSHYSSLSSARPLHDNDLTQSLALAPTDEAIGIALPSDKVNNPEEKYNKNGKVPCHDKADADLQNSDMGISVSSPRIAGKYPPLVLNMLPKGTVPPSGPSKGTNDVKN